MSDHTALPDDRRYGALPLDEIRSQLSSDDFQTFMNTVGSIELPLGWSVIDQDEPPDFDTPRHLTPPVPYTEVPADVGDFLQYAPTLAALHIVGNEPPLIDPRPYCPIHDGYMAQGFDEWYCEDCERERALRLIQSDAPRPVAAIRFTPHVHAALRNPQTGEVCPLELDDTALLVMLIHCGWTFAQESEGQR